MKWIAANRVYDLYFEDENEGCTVEKSLCYETCDEQCCSVKWREKAPFKLKKPILPPMVFDHTFNTVKFYEGDIKTEPKRVNSWEVEVILDAPFRYGDLVTVGRSIDCWKIKPMGVTVKGYKHLIRKFTNQRVNKVDMKILKEAKNIKLKK